MNSDVEAPIEGVDVLPEVEGGEGTKRPFEVADIGVNKSLELAERDDPLEVVGSGVASRVEAEERVSERSDVPLTTLALASRLVSPQTKSVTALSSILIHFHVLKKNAAI